jgi:hypothetical protein
MVNMEVKGSSKNGGMMVNWNELVRKLSWLNQSTIPEIAWRN